MLNTIPYHSESQVVHAVIYFLLFLLYNTKSKTHFLI